MIAGLSLAIVGIPFPNKRGPSRRFELELCKPGEPVELVPEPKNPADPNAIAIFSCRGVQLGYVTAERAPLVRSYIMTGREVRAVFQGIAETGTWVRVAFDGADPVVDLRESARPARPATPDFYPDEIYPDD